MHGFQPEHCASCRTCPHGLTTSKCGRCLAAAASAARRKPAVGVGPLPAAEEHQGWEIFYVPELNGWRVRAPDAEPSPDSYRSVFRARKAIDDLVANPPPARGSRRGR
jgi:hypothetical protein